LKLYQNKEWLEKKYLEEKLTQKQIGKLCGVSQSHIRNWLYKLHIPIRSHSKANHSRQANHCILSKRAIEWINGELLGDGHLRSLSNYSAKFTYSSKYEEYIRYISNTLKSFGIKQSGKIYKRYHKNMDCYDYQYASLSYIELLSIHKQWYPNGKKIIPRNIKLTPETLRQHYIGDGSLIHKKKGKDSIILYTYGFLAFHVKWLVNELIKLGFKAKRWGNNVIYISVYSTKEFLQYIGKCPVSCYQYKFNYKVS